MATTDPAIRSARGTLRRARRALNRAEPFILEIAAVVDARRCEHHWSVRVLALRAGLHRNTVRRILDGRAHNLDLDTVIALAQAVGCTFQMAVPKRSAA